MWGSLPFHYSGLAYVCFVDLILIKYMFNPFSSEILANFLQGKPIDLTNLQTKIHKKKSKVIAPFILLLEVNLYEIVFLKTKSFYQWMYYCGSRILNVPDLSSKC